VRLDGVYGTKVKRQTFFPGLSSTVPTAFSRAPSILSPTVAFLALVAGAFFFSTRPVVVALARGLEMFALGFVGVDFLVVVVLAFVLVLVVVGSDAGLKSLRGALFPVACRVETIVV